MDKMSQGFTWFLKNLAATEKLLKLNNHHKESCVKWEDVSVF